MDTWQAIDEEGSALADDLATLDDRQWDAQSLCSQWRVRHVVGHLVGVADVRIAGLRMSATDSDWSAGNGPSVTGPLASIIFVMAGRTAPLGDLSGEGKQAPRARM